MTKSTDTLNAINPQKQSLALYFIIAFSIPIIATVFISLKDGLSKNLAVSDITTLTIAVIMAMVHAPAIAAIIAAIRDHGFNGFKDLFGQLKFWKFTAGWYFKALLIFPSAIISTSLLLWFISPNYAPVLNLSFITFGTLISAFWEELGWTGYATPKMLANSTPLKVGLVLGLIHAIWHFPASFWGAYIFHGKLFIISFPVSSVSIIILRMVAVWIYAKTKSLVLGWLTHAGFTTGQLILTSLFLTSKEAVVWQIVFMFLLILVIMFVLAKNWDLMKQKIEI